MVGPTRPLMSIYPIHGVHDDDDDSYSIRHWTDVSPGEVCFSYHRGDDYGPSHNNLISGASSLDRIATRLESGSPSIETREM